MNRRFRPQRPRAENERRSVYDPLTGEDFPVNSSVGRLVQLERKSARDRIENRVMYLIAVAVGVFGVYLYGQVQSLRYDQNRAQARTDTLLCERQLELLRQSRDTKLSEIRSDTELLRLVDGILRVPPEITTEPDSIRRQRETRAVLKEARGRIEGGIDSLREGEERLRVLMEGDPTAKDPLKRRGINCHKLPGNGFPSLFG